MLQFKVCILLGAQLSSVSPITHAFRNIQTFVVMTDYPGETIDSICPAQDVADLSLSRDLRF